ncbi:putative inward rectifier potassium channel [Skeletonema marinoi]|uniref:Inward rectifier potassium channel n=1 Tax=Skeletonema marinoi TaxID=267567 RepID=A0AAD8Y313_9STRA|nr:putative inward rectifier potassium channel [Skeletonema marinoi]
MYSKLMRLLAKAHVTFSSTLCVQFGRGNEGSTVRFGQFNFRASVAPAMAMKSISMEDLLNDSDEDTNKREDPLSTSDEGFPVIEFRMVNDRANHEGSEIWDAQIRGIIQLKKDVNPSNKPNAKATGGESTLDLDKKAYYQFALTPDSHPHFSRIWYARHVLNAESPLLKREIRDMIVQEGGKWDKDFNTASEIRQCLNEFISLRITLSGTSAVSANTVFAEHVYEYEDVVVGWRFANMVYEKEPKRKLLRRLFPFGRGEAAEVKGNCETFTKVDKALIHDIVPQPGDDYEDLAETSTLAQLGGLFKRN